MIDAYEAGIPGNGKPVPRRRQDGEDPLDAEARTELTRTATRAGHPARRRLHGEGQQAVRGQRRLGIRRVRVRRRVRYFRPGTTADTPPQANDAKCGFACHTIVQDKRLRLHGVPEAVTGLSSATCRRRFAPGHTCPSRRGPNVSALGTHAPVSADGTSVLASIAASTAIAGRRPGPPAPSARGPRPFRRPRAPAI